MATIYAITDSIIEKIQKADLTANRGYRSSISSLDNIFRLDKKQLTIITGKANNGKTTFLDYYTYMLAKNAGLKTLFLSFETDINLHVALLLKYADKEILKSKLCTFIASDYYVAFIVPDPCICLWHETTAEPVSPSVVRCIDP